MSRIFLSFVFVLFSFVALAQQSQAPMRLPVDEQPLVIHTQKGEFSFDLEIAQADEERERGLMFRTDFPQDRAMLFIFDYARTINMWMENTPLPLDMLFLDIFGKVISIKENAEPYSRDIISSNGAAGFTVELNAGVAKKIGVRAGDRVKHPTICGDCK